MAFTQQGFFHLRTHSGEKGLCGFHLSNSPFYCVFLQIFLQAVQIYLHTKFFRLGWSLDGGLDSGLVTKTNLKLSLVTGCIVIGQLFLNSSVRDRQEIPQVLFVSPLEKHPQTPPSTLCFPQLKPQVSNYPLTPPSVFHKLFLRLFEKRDKL